MAATAIRVLLTEDVASDAELEVRELKRSGLSVEHRVVDTEDAFRRALQEFAPDVILSDFSMPQFDGMSALAIARKASPDTPFIFVSGTLGEEYAIRALKSGATDYVLKTNLIRLPAAVERALQDAREQALKRKLERELALREAGLRRAQIMARLAHIITAPDGSFESWSDTLPELTGLESARLPRTTRVWLELVHPDDRALFRGAAIEAQRGRKRVDVEYRLRRPDGTVIHVRQTMEPLGEPATTGKSSWFNTLQDVSEQNRAEEELRRFRLAMDNSGDMILLIDRATMRFIDANAAACRLLGYSRAEMLAMGPQDVLPVSRSVLEKSYDKMIANPSQSDGMNTYYRCRDGSELPFESTRRVLRSGDAWVIVAISRDMRERIAAEQALRESEAQYRTTFELAGSGVAHVDMTGRFLRVNPKLCEILGYAEHELVELSVKQISHPEDRDVTDAQRAKMHAGEVASMSFEKRYLRKDGTVIWVSLSVALQRDAEGKPLYEISIVNDITPRKLAEQRIERLNRVYAVLSGINGAIVRIRDRQELFAEACRIAVQAGRFRIAWIGLADRERKRITPVAWNDLATEFIKNLGDRHLSINDGATNPSAQAVRNKKPFISNDVESNPLILLKEEHRALGIRSLTILPLLVSGEAVGVLGLHAGEAGFFDDEEMRLLLELAGDIAFALDHIQKEEKLQYLAYYDSLTGLTNRTLFLERLAQRVGGTDRERRKFALCMLNVERFKNINDSLGRQAGDDLLKQIARRLLETVSNPKHVARIGADHFAILMPDVPDEQKLAHSVEDKLEHVDGEAFALGDTTVTISLKAGIALYPADATDAETLFRNAEAALRKAKTGGAPYLFYAPEMMARVFEKLSLENKLRQALEKDEFVLHYQPKVDLASRAVLGVEALIRWQSPELGLVPPLKFIPLLEETGLIMPVGTWALKRAADDHRKLVELGFKALRVAVNVSPIQLRHRDFVDSVEQAIIGGIAPTGIDLEITESLIMEDIKGNIEKLSAARGLGVKIAIDDFGTGYSSLGYLAKLPVQCLKIDRSFIITMDSDPNASTLVQTIISLAHSLGLEVVAEGVETEEQAKLLRLFRCDQMQGYLFSKPLPLNELLGFLQRGTGRN